MQSGPDFDRLIPLGDLVAQYPAAADVLKSRRIDFCCGGHRTLQEALQERGLPEDEVMEQLAAACRTVPEGRQEDWARKKLSDLIDHIVDVHHGYLYRALPELEQYTRTIMNVHGSRHPELAQVHERFKEISQELTAHLPKEETIMFPAIRQLESEPSENQAGLCRQLIESLEDEHEACGHLLKKIREITFDYALPEDACPTYRVTYQKLQALESDLFQHIHLENNVLFPRVLRMAM